MTVKEGSVENPANITLMLSANSYGFSVVISIEPMHPDLPRSVEFAVDTTNAVSINIKLCTCTCTCI